MRTVFPFVLPTVWHETSSLPTQATQDPKNFSPSLKIVSPVHNTETLGETATPPNLCACTMSLQTSCVSPCFFKASFQGQCLSPFSLCCFGSRLTPRVAARGLHCKTYHRIWPGNCSKCRAMQLSVVTCHVVADGLPFCFVGRCCATVVPAASEQSSLVCFSDRRRQREQYLWCKPYSIKGSMCIQSV